MNSVPFTVRCGPPRAPSCCWSFAYFPSSTLGPWRRSGRAPASSSRRPGIIWPTRSACRNSPTSTAGGDPDRDTQYVYNLQSVVPIHFAGAWTLFARAILPLIDQPGSEPGQGYTFGIGDIQPTLIFSPPSSKSFIWGFRSVFQFPSAASTSLGTGKWEIGPTAAAVLTGSWWQLGGQVNNLWSFAGDASRPAVNTMLLQPLVNLFLPDDWYLTFNPQMTANWKASSGNQWTVPIGGGIGRAFTIGRQGGTAPCEAYSNPARPAVV